MSLHQQHFNKINIKFKTQPNRVLPLTCDSIVRNLINTPRRHLRLINKKNNVTDLFEGSTHRTPKIKKMGNHLIKGFSVNIQQQNHKWDADQLTDFLAQTDTFSANIDGFYIMQPIVIDADTFDSNTSWTLIEGQQRVTNIYMVLKYLEVNNLMRGSCKSSTDLLNKYFLDTVNYENWDKFLDNKQGDNSSVNEKLSEVYQTLHDWFSKKSLVEQEIWKKKLLNHTKFIWYVTENELFDNENVLKTGGAGIESMYIN